jgi:hypothetical protein
LQLTILSRQRLAGQGQAKARAGVFGRAVQPHEWLEDVLDELRVDADPVVGDPHNPFVVQALGVDRDPRDPAAIVAKPVQDKVLEHLDHQFLVAEDADAAEARADLAAAFADERRKRGQDAGDHRRQVDGDQHRRFVEQGVLGHHIDQPAQSPRRGGQKSKMLARPLPECGVEVLDQQLAEGGDLTDGLFKIMRQGIGEGLQFAALFVDQPRLDEKLFDLPLPSRLGGAPLGDVAENADEMGLATLHDLAD